ncbi:transcriptional regulator, partial [Bacillus cereus]|nr:transcriptional regulator [Bacillus cereus]
MKNYTIEEKDSFIVFGIGTEIKSEYTVFAGINKDKESFCSAVKEDGWLD